jgi:hypothetical protein
MLVWGSTLRRASAKNVLFFSFLLLVPAAAFTQQTLPDAPDAVTAQSPASLQEGMPPAQTAAAPAADLTGDPAAVPFPGTSAIAGFAGIGVQDWQTGIAQAPRTVNEYARQGIRIDLGHLLARMDRPAGLPAPEAGLDSIPEPLRERYHWKGLLWESFAFFGVENAQRLLSDPFFRLLTADKPYWHDYIASVKQWNWRRWNDGDDFLVAYIAHPLQGSVTEFIEIQNSPRQRGLRINDGDAYWKSRFGPALMWATVYSFDQKLGPLGETALGSEGGYTYIVGCPFYCSAYFENPSQFKVTNNTGWVKLVTTPVVGTLWTVMEDAIDHLIGDRVQGDDLTRVFPKILRGSLNPARTMANALRWRKPWYRDWQQGTEGLHLTPQPHFLPGDEDVIVAAPRYEIFPHYNAISLPVNTQNCPHCRETTTGFGVGFSRRLATYADLDADLDYQPNASPLPSDRAGGNIVITTVGLKSGYTNKYFSVKAYLRPGILSYGRAFQSSPSETNPTPTIGRITHFTTALGLVGDYPINRYLALRGVWGNQPVRYREPYLDPPSTQPGTYPYLRWLSPLNFLTNENWAYQAGAVLRF